MKKDLYNKKKVEFENRMREKNTKYSEYFAQALLAIAYDQNFIDSVADERPDIHLENKNISHGVEVTRSVCSYFKTLKRYESACANKGLTIEEFLMGLPLEYRNKLGINRDGKLEPLVSLGKENSITKTKKLFADILDAKLDRLQQYKKFDKNSLFIIATELNDNFTIHQMLSAFLHQSKLKDYTLRFDNIMVFTYDKLVVFDLHKHDKSFEEIKISTDTIDLCNKYAYRKINNANVDLKSLLPAQHALER